MSGVLNRVSPHGSAKRWPHGNRAYAGGATIADRDMNPVLALKSARTALSVFLVVAAPGVLARDFSACLGELRREAAAQGITTQVFDKAVTGLEPDQSALDAMDSQPEFTTPI